MSEHTVAPEDAGIRLDRWFKRHLPHIPHALLEKALRKGDVRVAGKKAKSSDRIEAGQTLLCKLNEAPAAERIPTRKASGAVSEHDAEILRRSVLFKNETALVINKPAGLAVQGGTGIGKSVDSLLGALRFDAHERPKLVHRLDRDTSGVLVLARSAKAAARLTQAFAGKEAEKIYWALVLGAPPEEGTIDLPLSKQEEGDREKVAVDEKEGKRAVTLYRVIERLSRTLTWVELKPITGRTHQLRVHMAASGYPILGDGKYGGRDAFLSGLDFPRRLHLHARRIRILGVLDVTAPLSPHMRQSFKTLGLDERDA